MIDDVAFLLIRSARRTLAIEIKPDATLVVRAPRRASMREINRFVESHGEWIIRKQAAALAYPRPRAKEFIDGEEFLLRGQSCRLILADAPSPAVDFDGRLLLSRRVLPRAREAVVKWYKSRARIIFTERVEKFAAEMGCRPTRLRITSPLRRWGSCGPGGGLNFNWRLVMAPPEVIDYVVIHELAHLKHRNHGRDFWVFVEAHAPDFRHRKRWLKDNGHRLEI